MLSSLKIQKATSLVFFQIQNYGVGGHYDPHFDCARVSFIVAIIIIVSVVVNVTITANIAVVDIIEYFFSFLAFLPNGCRVCLCSSAYVYSVYVQVPRIL